MWLSVPIYPSQRELTIGREMLHQLRGRVSSETTVKRPFIELGSAEMASVNYVDIHQGLSAVQWHRQLTPFLLLQQYETRPFLYTRVRTITGEAGGQRSRLLELITKVLL